MNPREENISSTAAVSGAEKVCPALPICPEPSASIFYTDDNKNDEYDKQHQNMINDTISAEMQ